MYRKKIKVQWWITASGVLLVLLFAGLALPTKEGTAESQNAVELSATPVVEVAITTAPPDDEGLFVLETPDGDLAGNLEFGTLDLSTVALVELLPEEKEVLSAESGGVEGVTPVQKISRPCRKGVGFSVSGYTFNWEPGMDWRKAGYHPGIDGVCTDYKAAAAAPGKIWKIHEDLALSHWDSVQYWVSGRVIVIKFILETNEGQKEAYLVYGHLKYPVGNDPVVSKGQNVSVNEIIGIIGSTGRSTGTHLHFGVAVAKGNSLYWLNPTAIWR